ncbi:hypothetical protein [Chryseobacterium soli]|uniref:hypothetical protein n=1 Tax=Chryseobacterium soli TaxID=445961 RepID=UPI00068F81EA|nr:hypothetical protein [Chryseobacterium soli]
MSIKDKLKFEITSHSISLQPNRKIVTNFIWDMVGMVVLILVFLVFKEKIGEGGRFCYLAIIACIIAHLLITVLFRVPVRYIFDKDDNAIYRETKPFGRRQLMLLDEAIIFTRTESGDWYYCLGKKKKQFLKSYKVSPIFSSGKASQKRAEEYEVEILAPIMELLPHIHNLQTTPFSLINKNNS